MGHCIFPPVRTEDLKSTQAQRIEWAPQNLPRKRPRALTFPLPNKSRWNPLTILKKFQQTFDQSHSRLARLPGEIRQMIWIEAIGGHFLHITRGYKKLVALDCAENFASGLGTRQHGCWGPKISVTGGMGQSSTPGYYQGPRYNHSANPISLLPLLLTCRVIYTEVISMLYADNIFDINHLDTLIYLQHSVLPKRLNQIRVLNFTWNFKLKFGPPECSNTFPYDLDTWREACDVLTSLTGLQELTLHLTVHGHVNELWLDENLGSRYINHWSQVFEKLKGIRTAKKFEVVLPSWLMKECVELGRGNSYPFKLVPMSLKN